MHDWTMVDCRTLMQRSPRDVLVELIHRKKIDSSIKTTEIHNKKTDGRTDRQLAMAIPRSV